MGDIEHHRLQHIDVLRGVAVSLVVFQHVIEQAVLSAPNSAAATALNNVFGYYANLGRFGVVLFFLVSGFVIPNSFPNTKRPIRDFALNRVLRLYPMYWVSVAFAVAILPTFGHATFTLPQVLVNLTMFQSFIGVENVRIAYWTLAVELMFYIVCGGLFWAGLLQGRFNAAIIVVALSVLGTAVLLATEARAISRLMEIALDLSAMFLGKCVREYYYERRLVGKLFGVTTVAYAVFALVLSWDRYSGTYDPVSFFSSRSIASSYLGAPALFFLVSRFSGRCNSPTLCLIGVVSYSIYLMHAYVVAIYVSVIGTGDTVIGWAASLIGISALSVLISWATYELIERRCILLGRRLRSTLVASKPGRDDRVPV